jgi:hypothetical protein
VDIRPRDGSPYRIGRDTEGRHHLRCGDEALGEVYFTPRPAYIEKEDQKRLKDLGVTNVCFDLEVWDEDLWSQLLPGKAKAVGRKEWLRRLDDAVDVFGRGHVGTNFVAGFECAPRAGFMSQENALESYTGGFRELVERGIVPCFTIQ